MFVHCGKLVLRCLCKPRYLIIIVVFRKVLLTYRCTCELLGTLFLEIAVRLPDKDDEPPCSFVYDTSLGIFVCGNGCNVRLSSYMPVCDVFVLKSVVLDPVT